MATARSHLAEHGAAALSLRAMARDMNMAPSALFRYTANRDDLLTALIVESFNDLGDAVEAAEAEAQRLDHHARWQAMTSAFRHWAVTHPHDYALLYGSPVPDYRAPGEVTNHAGNRVLALVADLVRDMQGDASSAIRAHATNRRSSTSDLAAVAVQGLLDDPLVAGLPAESVARAVAAWNLVLGSLSSEIFNQLGPEFGDPQARFTFMCDRAFELLDPATGP